MNLLEEFINEYTQQNKKISKIEMKNICNYFMEYISLFIEKSAKENKNHKDEINIITFKGLGKLSIIPREEREIKLPNKSIKIPKHWSLRFKTSSVIKKKLKNE